MRDANVSRHGFTLVQISILLTIASLVMVNILPSTRSKLTSDNSSQTRLNNVMLALRQYQAANAKLPCPADASQPIGGASYGVAAANGGAATNCTGGAPAANYTDSTNHVAIGMVPVRALQLSNDAALDGYGRDITYAVDTNATGCWATSSLTGQITVTDNGTPATTVAALVSHGLDGHGAWIPRPGSAGSAVRLNTGSTDTDQLTNAHVDSSFNPTATLTNFVNKPVTTTFDDLVVYKSPQYTMNTLPAAVAVTLNGVTVPANGTYSLGNVLTFTAVYSKPVTVTGTPYLSLSAITGSIGTGNVAQATYQSGSGTTSLTFSYTVVVADSAPTGITLASPIVLNGGTINPCAPTAFTPPNLSGVIIQNFIYVADGENQRVEVFNLSGTYQSKFGSGWGTGNGHFAESASLAIDPSGNIWVLDNGNNRIEIFNSSGVYQSQIPCASGACATSSANGQFSNPQYIRFDTSGNLWVADSGNNRVEEFNSSGTWLKSIGGPSPYTCEATPAGSVPACASGAGNGQFFGPDGLAFDGSGNLWVTDFSNERLQKFNGSTGAYISKFGSSGTANGKFEGPNAVAIDASGNLCVVDKPNNRVEEFTSAGSFIKSIGGPSPYTCETVPAGSQPSCASGTGSGQFNGPTDIAIDGSGNVWVADISNDRVQEFNSSGTYLMSVGTGYQGVGGTIGTLGAGNGQLYWPNGLYIQR